MTPDEANEILGNPEPKGECAKCGEPAWSTLGTTVLCAAHRHAVLERIQHDRERRGADPLAELELDLECLDCGHEWTQGSEPEPPAPSFEPVDLGPVIAGDYAQPEPLILSRDDRRALFYVGEVNGVHGPSGEGKSFITLAAAVDELRRGHRVMLIDLEDNAPSIVARLRLLGATDAQIGGSVTYVRPAEPFGLIAVERLVELVDEIGPRLVVVDSLGEAFGLDGIDENSDAEVGPWLRRVARRIADLGPGVILVDHSTKANDNPLYPSGSKRKRAAIGGASYLVTASAPLVAGTGGRLAITCAKDRHGAFARGEHVGDWVMTTDAVGTRWKLYAPGPAAGAELPVILAARSAVEACKAEDGELSQRALLGLMKIKASTDVKRSGIDLAVARGALVEKSGPRNSRTFVYLAELPEVAE